MGSEGSVKKTASAVFSISGTQELIKLICALWACVVYQSVFAQDNVYRCGNEYTNNVSRERLSQCTLITTGNVTVVPATKPRPTVAPIPSAQRNKDSDSRFILESELKKAEARHVELLKEYNNGEPEKVGAEARNYQKYLDRVADLKANLQRNEADIASIRREIARIPGGLSR
jgi:hypothetical protein